MPHGKRRGIPAVSAGRGAAGFGPAENRSGIELLRQAIALDPGFEKAWSRLSWRYQWETYHGNTAAPDSWLTLAQHALELNPDSPDADYALGTANLATERFADARRACEQALVLDPAHESALADGGYLASITGNAATGLRLSAATLRTSPNVPNRRFHVAIPLLAMGDAARLQTWLDRARIEGLRTSCLDLTAIWLDVLGGNRETALVRIRDGLSAWGDIDVKSPFMAGHSRRCEDMLSLPKNSVAGSRFDPQSA